MEEKENQAWQDDHGSAERVSSPEGEFLSVVLAAYCSRWSEKPKRRWKIVLELSEGSKKLVETDLCERRFSVARKP